MILKKKKEPKKKSAKLKYLRNLATLVEIFKWGAVLLLFWTRMFCGNDQNQNIGAQALGINPDCLCHIDPVT